MAQVTTADIRTRIKAIIDGNTVISGFDPSVHVFGVAPMALNRALLPAIVIKELPTTYDNGSMGERYVKPSGIYAIELYMQEWTANPDINIQANLIDSFTTEIENEFALQQALNDLKGVRDSKLLTNTGIIPRQYPQTQNGGWYVAKIFNLSVTYTRTI